jgi:hypothetical protein
MSIRRAPDPPFANKLRAELAELARVTRERRLLQTSAPPPNTVSVDKMVFSDVQGSLKKHTPRIVVADVSSRNQLADKMSTEIERLSDEYYRQFTLEIWVSYPNALTDRVYNKIIVEKNGTKWQYKNTNNKTKVINGLPTAVDLRTLIGTPMPHTPLTVHFQSYYPSD